MGLDWSNSDDAEEEESENKSGTHIYFYERGHDRLPGEEGDEAYESIASAYETAKTRPDGRVRNYANGNFEGGLQQMLAEFVNTMDSALEQGGPLPIIDLALGDMPAEAQDQVLAQYLDQNPEVAELLVQRIQSSEAAESSDEGEDSPQPADD